MLTDDVKDSPVFCTIHVFLFISIALISISRLRFGSRLFAISKTKGPDKKLFYQMKQFQLKIIGGGYTFFENTGLEAKHIRACFQNSDCL